MELKNKTALVTGSAIRLGKAISLMLAGHGCNLALHYNSSIKSSEEVFQLALEQGVKAQLFRADLSDPANATELIYEINQQLGQIDILINNAAIYLPGRAAKTDLEKLNRQFDLNLFSPLLLTKAFAEQIPDGGHGKVINISDAKSFRVGTDHFAYRLTKAALNQMTKMFALELAPRITVNAVAPGVMMPLAGHEDLDLQPMAEERIPLKRIGSPELVAENVLHLLMQDFITGQIILVDGGENL